MARHAFGAAFLAGHDEGGHRHDAVRVAVPAAMAKAYAEMAARAPGLRPPKLEFYDDLGGVGGLFMADHWAIAVGVADINQIVDALMTSEWRAITQIAREIGQTRGVAVTNAREVMLGSAYARCIAHELGHALIFAGSPNPYAPDNEAGADYYAGRLDAARDVDWRLGTRFLRAIGCVGPACDHPAPDQRQEAYAHGYNEQLSRAA